jgi:hypothetical protein
VGLNRGETQVAEYFGGNCGYRHCPTGNDPRTPSIDETDCNGTLAPGGYGIGKVLRRGGGGEEIFLHRVHRSNRGYCFVSSFRRFTLEALVYYTHGKV